MKRYLIVVEDVGTNFSAHSPDVPNVFATGDTELETGLRDSGDPVPRPSARTYRIGA